MMSESHQKHGAARAWNENYQRELDRLRSTNPGYDMSEEKSFMTLARAVADGERLPGGRVDGPSQTSSSSPSLNGRSDGAADFSWDEAIATARPSAAEPKRNDTTVQKSDALGSNDFWDAAFGKPVAPDRPSGADAFDWREVLGKSKDAAAHASPDPHGWDAVLTEQTAERRRHFR